MKRSLVNQQLKVAALLGIALVSLVSGSENERNQSEATKKEPAPLSQHPNRHLANRESFILPNGAPILGDKITRPDADTVIVQGHVYFQNVEPSVPIIIAEQAIWKVSTGKITFNGQPSMQISSRLIQTRTAKSKIVYSPKEKTFETTGPYHMHLLSSSKPID
ncbi:hypothetical protein FEM03_16810 [Phragmitibacter flavus]|uniref:Organic solvent tolerance-like N-terminal domain-containing protein n=1 Tax=Phragmitibacter flavus TaxID=2576071 RepID=A0A5R8KBD2_9BACT|nr:hypothetical protein [Phragmitibacter flavus]TLD69618.1 hypothetical protein FEM03_16810 [Phragmitibacter flavus]